MSVDRERVAATVATALPVWLVALLAAAGVATDTPAIAALAVGAGAGYSLSGSV